MRKQAPLVSFKKMPEGISFLGAFVWKSLEF